MALGLGMFVHLFSGVVSGCHKYQHREAKIIQNDSEFSAVSFIRANYH